LASIHDARLRPDGLAYGTDVLDIFLDPETHLQLHGPESFAEVALRLANAGLGGVLPFPAVEPCRVRGELGAEPSPEQLVDGQGEGPPYDVPEGYVYAAQGVECRAAPEGPHAVVQFLPKHLGVEGVPADEHRLVAELDEGGRHLGRLQPVAEGLAPSGDSLVGHHLHYHGAAPAHQALGEGEGFLQRRGQHVGDHVDDFHPSDSPHLTVHSSLALPASYREGACSSMVCLATSASTLWCWE